jgi:transcriptional regulator with XRE-family HTH domain
MPRPDSPQPALGAAIRALRDERELKQANVAEDAGITVAHLSKIEGGKVNPTWTTVVSIGEALGVSISELAKAAEKAVN